MVTTVSEYTSAAVSDRGLNESRPQNEDSYLELPQYGLFAVADGVGGAQAGEVASQMAVEILGEAFVNMGQNADPEDTMRAALTRANEAIFQMSHDIPQLSSMATTIAAVHVSGDMATIAHVGDSRVYRLDALGRLIRETDDHSVVEEEVRAGRMTAEQALNHPSRNVISRALGADDTVSADIKCVLVHPGTTFLLCSDGITRHISDLEIEQLLNSEFGPQDICARMKEVCFERGAEDNLTAVVIRFPGERQLTSLEPEDDGGIEEVTIAGVREQPLEEADTDENIEVPAEVLANAHVPTADPPPVQQETVPAEEILPVHSESTEFRPEGVVPAPAEVATERIDQPSVAPERHVPQPQVESEAAAPKGLGPVLMPLAFLLFGGLLGAGSVFFFLKPEPPAEVPALPVQQSNNVTLTSFESTRRLVDEDPERYLNAKAATPQEADDFFWLGRALLLTGKPVEARRQFEEAKARLATFDDRASARTMATEIAMALSIIDDQQASEAFARQLAPESANTNTNANTDSAPFRPRRRRR